MTVKRYRKKPVVIEAMRLSGSKEDAEDAAEWIEIETGERPDITNITVGERQLWAVLIETLEGTMEAGPGFLIQGVAREFYPCKEDIFAATYEEAE